MCISEKNNALENSLCWYFLKELMHPFTAKLYDHSQQFALLHIVPTSQSDTLHPGEGAQVCEIEGNEFSCPTANASINAPCDRERCPLQGPPIAPIMESQLMTGLAKKDFERWDSKNCKNCECCPVSQLIVR